MILYAALLVVGVLASAAIVVGSVELGTDMPTAAGWLVATAGGLASAALLVWWSLLSVGWAFG